MGGSRQSNPLTAGYKPNAIQTIKKECLDHCMAFVQDHLFVPHKGVYQDD